jgi:hypothetical protein
MKVYAVPQEVYKKAGGKAKPEWFDGKMPGVLKSEEGVTVQRTTRNSDPATRIVTHYQVTIKEGKLTLKHVADKRYDNKNKEVASAAETESLLPDVLVVETSTQQRLWFYLGVPLAAACLAGFVLYRRGTPRP